MLKSAGGSSSTAVAGDTSSAAISVKNATYGATGDGTTDDTTAVQAAATAAIAAKLPLYFPPGTYKITTAIDFGLAENVEIYGAGAAYPDTSNAGNSQILVSGAIVGFTFGTSGTTKHKGPRIRDLGFRAAGSTELGAILVTQMNHPRFERLSCGDFTVGYFCTLANGTDAVIEPMFIGCQTRNTKFGIIAASAGSAMTILGGYYNGSSIASGIGLKCPDSANVLGAAFDGWSTAININGYGSFIRGRFEGNTTHINIAVGGRNILTGNYFIGGTNGVVLSNDASQTDNVVKGNTYNSAVTNKIVNNTLSTNTAWIDEPQINMALGSIIAPTDSTKQNDYAPAGISGAREIRWAGTASTGLTGLVSGSDGREVIITNGTTDYLLWLESENTASVAANRFKLPQGFPAFLMPGDMITLRYDSTASRWRVLNWAMKGDAMGLSYFNDFNGEDLVSSSSGGAAAFSSTSLLTTTERPVGIASVASAGGTTDRSTIGYGGSGAIIPTLGAALHVSRIGIPSTVDGTNTFSVLTGFADAAAGTFTDGVAWEYRWTGSVAEWSHTLAAGAVLTRTNTGSPAPDNTFVWCVIFVNPGWTRADFIYSQDSVAFTLAESPTAGFPSNAQFTAWCIATLLKSAGTTARSAIIDFAGYRVDQIRG